MSNLFAPVQRQKMKLRMALTGVSGGGKTLGALYLAYGLTDDWGKVALIDTERERGRAYASRSDLPTPTGEYLYAGLYAPYSPERYKEYVRQAAEAVGPDGVVIVDSLSHAWNNEGGVLEIKDRIAAQAGKNSYTAWNEAGREQNGLINYILGVDCHTIVTMRSKMEYAMELNERGKQQPVKIGLAPVQRDDTEYEFDIVMNIGRDHIATTSKDVTFLDGFGAVITPELGRQLRAWLADGKEPERYFCADCSARIRDSAKGTARARAAATQEHFGRTLCEACTKQALREERAAQAREEANDNDTGQPPQG